MSQTELIRRYLDAYNTIDKTLKGKVGADEGASFTGVVSRLVATDSMVRRHERALKSFASLRNAIVHERYRQGAPIATPHQEVVVEIERICDQLLNPPRIGTFVQGRGQVQTAAPDEGVWSALRSMAARSHSQALVYGSDGYVGLLTTNAIARWVASNVEANGDVYMAEGAVAEVLEHAEPFEQARFVPTDRLVTDVIDIFGDAKGAPIAVVITQNGKPVEKPLGIVVVHDLPDLLARTTV